MHALIVGERGVGKSTLIRGVLKELNYPLSGFETRKEDALADEIHGSPIYIYRVGLPYVQSPENLLGYAGSRKPEIHVKTFDRYAPKLRELTSEGIILLDEIGFMESSSETFCDAMMELLDGEIPIIAAVKHRDIPFLNKVRSHPNCHCFLITEDNRDALHSHVADFLRLQLEERRRQH